MEQRFVECALLPRFARLCYGYVEEVCDAIRQRVGDVLFVQLAWYGLHTQRVERFSIFGSPFE